MLLTYSYILSQGCLDMHFLDFSIQEKSTPLQFNLE